MKIMHQVSVLSYRLHNWNKPFATSHTSFSLRKSHKTHTMMTLLYMRWPSQRSPHLGLFCNSLMREVD